MRPSLVSSVLDLLGSLLVVLAAVLLVARWSVPGACLAAGVGLLAVAWLIDFRSAPKKKTERSGT